MKNLLRFSTRQFTFRRDFKRLSPSYFQKSHTYSDQLLDQDKTFLSRFAGGSVDFSKDEATGIATVTLNHPEKLNAFSGKMMTDLHDIVCELESWTSGRGVLLQGAAGTFCSGGDLNVLKALVEKEGGGCIMSRFLQNTLTRLYHLPLVSLAFIEGSKLVEIVGRTTALKLLSSAQVQNSNDAVEIGLADKIVSSKEEAVEFLKTFTQRGKTTEVQQAAKRVVVIGTSELSFEEKMNKEYDLFEQIFGGPALIHGLKSNQKFSKRN